MNAPAGSRRLPAGSLPAGSGGLAAGAGVPPEGPVETTLAALWAGLLGVEGITRHDSFFALGGDSLLATQLVEAIRRELAAPVTLRALLDAPTVAQLARLITEQAPVLQPELMEEGVI